MKQAELHYPKWIRWLLFMMMLAIVIFAGIHIYNFSGHGAFLGHFDKIWGAIFIAFLLISVVFLGGFFGQLFFPKKTIEIVQPLLIFRHQLHWFRWFAALVFPVLSALLLCYSNYSYDFSSLSIRLYIFVVSVVFSGILLTNGSKKILTWTGLLNGIVLFGSVFLVAKKLITVTNYPLSLSWSEGNRLWDYSVLFGRDLYIYPANQPIEALIDLGRQSLWGVPFLFSNVTISQVRLWSVLVGLLPHALLGWILFRIPSGNRRIWFFMGLWTLIFLQQGPIYSPLILAAILVAFTKRRSLWLGLPLVFIAGLYASTSRFTWMFAPAIWAMMIAIFDHPPQKFRQSTKSWGYIFAYGLAGLIGGVGVAGWEKLRKIFDSATDEISNASSANGLFGLISDQPLIWSRLLPSSTYSEGILLGLLIAVGPLIVFLLYLAISNRWELNRFQIFGLLIPLLLFLVVGLIVSVKIGGGDNLHNLDMFLITLVFITALAWEGAGETTIIKINEAPLWLRISVVIAAAIPAFYSVMDAAPLKLPPKENIELTIEFIQKESRQAVSDGKEVLFMDQRQLLTFGVVEDVPLVADYEKKQVMNKAMSGDGQYFEGFYNDLANHRFGLIVTEPQNIIYATADDAWAEENDFWIEWVTKPLLCYYEPKHDFKKTSVWLFVPRAEPLDCFYP